jgi:aryl-alcohol dehydrogenase-like predicted oxidoreductase
MKTITLGKSGLTVSRIAFGTWQLGGDWGPTDEESATAAIRRAADSGVTFFDTAQAYGFGASERLLAGALHGRPREDLVIATKGGLRPSGSGVARDASGEWIRKGVDESLHALDTAYIDLYQIHWPDPSTPFAETAGALAELVAEGKIRHVGVSNFDADQMEALSANLPVETLQPPYHLFRREIEADVLPYAAAHDIGVLVYGPLAHGLLGGHLGPDTRFAPGDWRATSDVFHGAAFERNLRTVADLQRFAREELGISLGQLAIAWTLANPSVHVAIVGTRSPAHVDEAVAAADIELSEDAMRRIDEIVRHATPIAGPSPETV